MWNIHESGTHGRRFYIFNMVLNEYLHRDGTSSESCGSINFFSTRDEAQALINKTEGKVMGECKKPARKTVEKFVIFKDTSLARLREVIQGINYDLAWSIPSKMKARKNFKNVYNGGTGLWYANDDAKNPIKLGKILNAVDWENTKTCGVEVNEKLILSIVEKWKEKYTIDEDMVNRIELTNELQRVYDYQHASGGTIGSSCMRGYGEYYGQMEAQKVCRIAYLMDADDSSRLIGRALIWDAQMKREDSDKIEDVTFMDRIYYANDNALNSFKAYAVKNNWMRKTHQNYDSNREVTDIKDNEFYADITYPFEWDCAETMPYLDTLTYYVDNKFSNNYRKSTHSFDCTEGDCNQTCCGCCDEYYDSNNEGAYVESEDMHVCDSCLSDEFVYVTNGYGYYRTEECTEINGEWYKNDDLVYDGIDDCHIVEDDAVCLADGQTTHYNNATMCSNTDEWLENDDDDLITCGCGCHFDKREDWDCDNCNETSEDKNDNEKSEVA